MKEILEWTQGQPFLTQKLCQLAISSSHAAVSGGLTIPPGSEAYWVEQLVRNCIIQAWESQDEPEHLRTIGNRILNNPEHVGRLLGLYQQVLDDSHPVAVDDSREQIELLLAGLVSRQNGYLRVKNPIYAHVFNRSWVEQQLSILRPYARALEMWLASNQTDDSRLLRGQALKDAQTWSRGKRLGDEDYQFLAASVESDRKTVHQAAEAERIQLKLAQEQQTSTLQRRFLGAVSAAFLISLGFGAITFGLYRRTQLSEIEAIATAAEGRFESHYQLEALQQIVTAKAKLRKLYAPPPELTQQVQRVLQRTLDGASVLNQLRFDSEVRSMDIHPNGDLLAVITSGGTLSFWQPNGSPAALHWIFEGKKQAETQQFSQVQFSPNGKQLVTLSSADIQLWERAGNSLHLVKQFESPVPQIRQISFMPGGRTLLVRGFSQLQLLDLTSGEVTELPADYPIAQSAVSPKGDWIAAAYRLKILTAQSLSGKIPRSLGFDERQATHDKNVSPSPSGQPLPTQSRRGPQDRPQTQSQPHLSSTLGRGKKLPNIRVWDLSGNPIHTFINTTKGPIFAFAVNPVRNLIAAAHVDGQIILSQPSGEMVQELYGSRSKVRELAFSPDGNLLAVGDTDGEIQLWNVDGSRIKRLLGHRGSISQLRFSPDGTWLASASKDSTVRLWRTEHPHQRILAGHTDMISKLFYSPDGNQLYSLGVDQRMNIWQRDADKQLHVTPKRSRLVNVAPYGLSVSEDRRLLAQPRRSGRLTITRVALETNDKIIDVETTKNHSITSHSIDERPVELENIDRVSSAAIAPSGQQLVVGNREGKIHWFEAAPEREAAFAAAPWQTVSNGPGNTTAMAWSPDETWMVAGYGSGDVWVWRDGVSFPLQSGGSDDAAHQAAVSAIAVSPDGRWIASGAKDKTIKVWSQAGELLHTLVGHDAGVAVLAFRPNHPHLASASIDSTINLWQIGEQISNQEALLRSLTGHIGQLNTVAFSPDGNELATAGTDRRIIVWKLNEILQRDGLSDACNHVRNYLQHYPGIKPIDRQLCD